MNWLEHLTVAPILIPLVAGGFMLLLDGRNRTVAAAINVVATLSLLVVAIMLVALEGGQNAGGHVYLLGNWPAPFGIVLVADRLSVLMLLVTAILGSATLLFALARWDKAGAFFHPLFQFLLMGLNGAFLTGDIFNLFVFFEVLLAASYGLALHGSGPARVKAGLHYIAINLVAALLFLIGASLIYGTAGTLNMAALATRIAGLPPDERLLFEIGVAVLGVAFLVKSAMWPIGFWLPNTYAAAAPPIAAMFSILTKVGIYAVLRLGFLVSSSEDDVSLLFGGNWLMVGGIATILFGMIGIMASQEMAKLAGFSVLVSSGTLLAAIGYGGAAVTGGALFYLVSSTFAIAAFFLLIELVERGRAPADDVLAVTLEAYGLDDPDEADDSGEVGIAIPAIMAILGSAFIACAVLLSGLPPLSGFVAKFAILSALVEPTRGPTESWGAWAVFATILMSGLATLIAMTRAGIRTFWASIDRDLPHVRVVELAPVAILLILCIMLTVQAGWAMRYMRMTAEGLARPGAYIGAVFAAPPAQTEPFKAAPVATTADGGPP
ncbi:monovalent cation/H+ antiporter subunit D [Chelatococcus asaccharovorans]|uniref:Multisubunit potassium/proton antiporter PhaD subunit n=1 Tax=Chelatococcus asaccharovorans TaxID=28210 RepID=A0A2V3UH61_9HYPH|nr:monovalent cation/H+ antiporter subunit D [Chelatococcus asaccharovorans]MBS7701807.1 monovalent cation/H+ antiporter subunit D [Chelatococcus asaccharovorans]PXW64486.1 multisubunit potassium/proton antiporter PhaD subunit [Chelatococcus asaccharovorans]